MTTFPDPLENQPEDISRWTGSFWWSLPAHKKTRDAKEWETVRALLAAGDWQEPGDSKEDRKKGGSLTAWRALIAGTRFEWVLKALDEGLAPAVDQAPHWWASKYWRGRGLRDVFMPAYPIPTEAVALEKYQAQEELREAVAQRFHQAWPQLATWFMESASPQASGLYRHPLVIAARPGYELVLARLLEWRGFEPLLEDRKDSAPLATPTQLLSLALSRRCKPLLEFAWSKGASPSDPVLDFKGAERSMLHEFVARADSHARDWLLSQSVALETWDRHARTPFLLAARMADVESLEALAAHGANVHATDRFGQTAAHLVIEGLRTTEKDEVLSRLNQRYESRNKSSEKIQEGLERAAQALAQLQKLGVDLSASALPTPKNTKRSPSPFAVLPRVQRTKISSIEGETWEEQLRRRCEDDPLLPRGALAFVRETLLESRWAAVVPPEPEEESLEPVLDVPVPTVTRRPRL